MVLEERTRLQKVIKDRSETALHAANVDKKALADHIADSEQALLQLRASHALLELAMEQVRSTIWATDTDLRLSIVANGVMPTSHFGVVWEVGKTIYEIFKSNDPNYPPITAHLKALNGVESQLRVFSVSAPVPVFRTVIPVDFDLTAGVKWIGVAGVLPLAKGFIRELDHRDPGLPGNGTLGSSKGINPPGGTGFGQLFPVGTNVCYRLSVAGEAGFVGLARPDDYILERGRRVYGDKQSLREADDDHLRVARFIVSNQIVDPIIVEVFATSPVNFATRINLRTRTRVGIIATMRQRSAFFNFRQGAYSSEIADSTIDSNWSSQSFELPRFAGEYIGPANELRCRLSFRQVGPSAATPPADIDLVRWDFYL